MAELTIQIQAMLATVEKVFPPPAVDEEYVQEHFDALVLVEPESRIPAMLSAHLIVALKNFSPQNEVCEFLIYALSPGKDWEKNKEWWCRRLTVLNQAQVNVLIDFLNLVQSDSRFSGIFAQVKRSLPRLIQLWEIARQTSVYSGSPPKSGGAR